jgi:hypothetical protein
MGGCGWLRQDLGPCGLLIRSSQTRSAAHACARQRHAGSLGGLCRRLSVEAALLTRTEQPSDALARDAFVGRCVARLPHVTRAACRWAEDDCSGPRGPGAGVLRGCKRRLNGTAHEHQSLRQGCARARASRTGHPRGLSLASFTAMARATLVKLIRGCHCFGAAVGGHRGAKNTAMRAIEMPRISNSRH